MLGDMLRQLLEIKTQLQPNSPSQRDFPNRTNYGVPEDNMIDTPNGYVTPAQYDQMPLRSREEVRRAPFRMFEDNSFQGNPRMFQMGNPSFKFFEDNTFSQPSGNPLNIVQGGSQPFGRSYEDTLTGTQALQQPSRGFTGQNSLNGGFLQGSSDNNTQNLFRRLR